MTPTPTQPGWLQAMRGAVQRGLSSLLGQPRQPGRTPGHQRNYAAAAINRLTDGWTTVGLSANTSINASLDTLRARSRQLAQDDPYASKFLKLVRTNIVGPDGFRFEARVYDQPAKPDTSANNAIEASLARWSARGVCDVAGRLSLSGICGQLINAAARDGEFLVRIIRGADAGNPYQLALQVLDVDRLDTQFNRAASATENAVRMGIELNQFGRPVAYHLRTHHPGEIFHPTTNATRQRIAADDIIHGFIQDRPEQVRGVPWMHAAMLRMNNLGGYEEAAIIASRVGASKMGFFERAPDAPEVAGLGLAQEATDGTGAMHYEADPGTFDVLPEGYKFSAFNPDYPAAMFGEFVKANLRGIASGLGVSYHALSNDLEGVSFSSIRSGTLEERDHWTMLQAWFVDAFLEPLFREWLTNALAFGLVTSEAGRPLPLAKLDKFTGHQWQGRRWEWVDPLRDIQTEIAAVNAGLKAPQDVVAKLGGDYEDTLIKIQAAQLLRERLGVQIGPAAAAPAQPADPAGAAA